MAFRLLISIKTCICQLVHNFFRVFAPRRSGSALRFGLRWPARTERSPSIAGDCAMHTTLSFFHTKLGLVICLLLAALGGYLLWTHTGHTLAALPYLLLLACPMMHFFGHGHRHEHYREADQRNL
jgi:hypothetical protein